MLQDLFKKREHEGATVAQLSRRLSPTEQWKVGEEIASGLNEVFESVYGERPTRGNNSFPSRDSDGVNVYATICGGRTKCRVRDTDVMVYINHLSIDQSNNPAA